MPRASYSLLLVACSLLDFGCDVCSPRVVQQNLAGAYSFTYAPTDGEAASTTRDQTTFFGRDVEVQCCLGVWYHQDEVLSLDVGSWIDDPGAPSPEAGRCPAVASLRLWVRGVPMSDAPRVVDLGQADTELWLYYADRGDSYGDGAECGHHVMETDANRISPQLRLTGELRIERLRAECDPRPDLGCALTADGSWSLSGTDPAGTPVLETAGTFAAADEVLAERQGCE